MDIVVIGAMKAATSTVCAYLEDHPGLYMVPGCEPNFFSHDENYAKGTDWYAAEYLKDRGDAPLCGEGSNYYSARALYPETAARMAAYNPQTKIIYMVRHPVQRIISAWIQNRTDQWDLVPPTLDQAVREMPDRFVGQSRYWYNIAPFREAFGDDQIFVGFMEDLNRDPEAFFKGLTDFLGLEPFSASRGHVNKSDGKRVPTKTFTALNKAPVRKLATTLLPERARSFIKQRILSQPLKEKPDFSPETRRAVIEVLKPDAAAFLAQYGKPADFWVIE